MIWYGKQFHAPCTNISYTEIHTAKQAALHEASKHTSKEVNVLSQFKQPSPPLWRDQSVSHSCSVWDLMPRPHQEPFGSFMQHPPQSVWLQNLSTQVARCPLRAAWWLAFTETACGAFPRQSASLYWKWAVRNLNSWAVPSESWALQFSIPALPLAPRLWSPLTTSAWLEDG